MSGDGDSDPRKVRVAIRKLKLYRRLKGQEVDVFVAFNQADGSIREIVVKDRERLSSAELEELEHKIWISSRTDGKGRWVLKGDVRQSVGRSVEIPPSSYLYSLGLLLDKSTREMVFTPLIDDFHHEYFEALSQGRPTRRLVWVYHYHGTVALLRALCLGFLKQLVSGGS